MNSTQAPRIVFMGTPDFAVASLKALIDNHFNVVAVVTAPDKPAGRGKALKASAVKEFALIHQLPLLQPEKLKNSEFIESLAAFKADLQVVVAFRMLPEVVWNMPAMGTLNVHASLLPQYRGAAPINRAIMNGETATGVTTFRLKHEIDTGNILLQERTEIAPDDTIGTLYPKLMLMGANLLVKTINGLINGTIEEVPQPATSEALKHAPKIFKEDGEINWTGQAQAINNQIRGLSPIPAAYTFLNDKQLKVFKAEVVIASHGVAPGSYQTDGKKYLRFAASDGWLSLIDVQFEGKKRMSIADFLRGYRFA